MLVDDVHSPKHGHPSVLFYNLIALSLFIITFAEVAVLYPPINTMGEYFKVILLVVLSLVKFAVVVAFFMHLFYDASLLTFLFGMGMVIGVGTVAALIQVMPAAEHPLQPTPQPAEGVETPAEHAFHERVELWRQRAFS